MQAQLQKNPVKFDCYKIVITEMFLHSVIQTSRGRLKLFIKFSLCAAKFCTVCIKTVCIHGSLQARSSWAVHVSGYQQRWRAGFPQKCIGHESSLFPGQAGRLSVYLFHGAGVAVQSPRGVVPVTGQCWHTVEPRSVALGLHLEAGSGRSWRR